MLDHGEGTRAAGCGQLFVVEAHPTLIVVDQHCGDAQVGLQNVVCGRLTSREGKRLTKGGHRPWPVLAGGGLEPWSNEYAARTGAGASSAGVGTKAVGSTGLGEVPPNADSAAASIASCCAIARWTPRRDLRGLEDHS